MIIQFINMMEEISLSYKDKNSDPIAHPQI